MASTEQIAQSYRDLLAEGVRAGVLSQTQADQRARQAGVEVVAPTTVTVTVGVTGDVAAANGYGRDTINRQVEAALTGAARQAGLTVVAGTTRVNF